MKTFKAREVLKGIIISELHPRSRNQIQALRAIYDQNQNSYKNLISKFFGLDEVTLSEDDQKLADIIISLHENTCAVEGGVVARNTDANVVKDAFTIRSWPDSVRHLEVLLGDKSFARDLLSILSEISLLKLIFEQFIETARTLETCGKVIIHDDLPKLSPSPTIPPQKKQPAIANAVPKAGTSPLKKTSDLTCYFWNEGRCYHSERQCIYAHRQTDIVANRPPYTQTHKSSTISPTPTATKSTSASKSQESKRTLATPENPVKDPSSDIPKDCRQYLPESERSIGLLQVKPAAKRQALALLDSVLQGTIPLAQEEAYLVFGFAACQTKVEATYLGGLYQALMEDCIDKEEMFKALWQSLETDSLLAFFERNGYFGGSLDAIPGAAAFLHSSSKRRPTVWRLIQFLRAEEITDPSGHLRRDYAFDRHQCRMREQVQSLKLLYPEILKKCSPLQLHEACVRGTIIDLATSVGVHISKDDARMIRSTVPHPDRGFETKDGPQGYEMPLFKSWGRK